MKVRAVLGIVAALLVCAARVRHAEALVDDLRQSVLRAGPKPEE